MHSLVAERLNMSSAPSMARCELGGIGAQRSSHSSMAKVEMGVRKSRSVPRGAVWWQSVAVRWVMSRADVNHRCS